MADIVLPATTSLERDDIGYGSREPFLIAMKKARDAVGEARDDYWIFAEIARRMGKGHDYTEGRDTMAWLKHLYELSRQKSAEAGVSIPAFDAFWQAGIAEAQGKNREPVMLAAFRADPAKNPLKTPSGKIEIYSEKIASFGYDDCPGHATWLEPIEWLGSKTAERYPLHMLSDQPADKLHSQLDHSPHARATKVKGRGRFGLQPAAGEAWQPQRTHPRHRRLQAEPRLHRPDLPGRDRALRWTGAGADRAPAARLHDKMNHALPDREPLARSSS